MVSTRQYHMPHNIRNNDRITKCEESNESFFYHIHGPILIYIYPICTSSYTNVSSISCFRQKKHVTNWRMFIWPSHKRSMRSKKGMKNIPYTDMLHMPTLTWICQYVCTYIPTNTFQMLSTKAAQRTGTFWKYPPRNHMFHMLHLPITSAVSIRYISRNIPS